MTNLTAPQKPRPRSSVSGRFIPIPEVAEQDRLAYDFYLKHMNQWVSEDCAFRWNKAAMSRKFGVSKQRFQMMLDREKARRDKKLV